MDDAIVKAAAQAIIDSDKAEPFFACACSGKKKPDDAACPCRMRAAERQAKAVLMVVGATGSKEKS